MIRNWHPLHDPYHCTYRILTLLHVKTPGAASIAKLSFLDLYFLFPQFVGDLHLTRAQRNSWNSMNVPRRKDSYVHLPDVRFIYRELQKYQRVALNRLLAQGILEDEDYQNGTATLKPEAVPADLLTQISTRAMENEGLLKFILTEIGGMSLEGQGGLLRQNHLEKGGRLR